MYSQDFTDRILYHNINNYKSYDSLSLYSNNVIDTEESVRGGPFDTWEGYGFSFVIKLFSTPSLNVHFFQTVSKANNFFLSGKTKNNFFHHVFHLILRTSC